MESKMISDKDVALRIGMSRSWLQIMRVKGGGPPFHKIGNSVRYDVAELEAWLLSRKCNSTSDDNFKAAREADDFPKHSKLRNLI